MKTKASPLVSPCLESTRCYLTCASRDVRLSCNSTAKVGTKNLAESCSSIDEEWSIIPVDDGLVALYSLKTKRYLSAGAGDEHGSRDGKCRIAAVEGCDSDQQRWKVEPSSAEKGGIHLLSAARKQSKLACNEDGELYLSENIYEGLGETWRIEFLSGELCYISSQNSHHDVRVRCDPTGILDVSENWKGWEVFRFIEAGDGSVYISSWTHSKYFLSSNSDGRVSARKKRTADEKWLVKKSKDQPGVLIISQQHAKALATNGKRLITMDPFDILASGDGGDVDEDGSKKSLSGFWDLAAGNRNTFFIASNSSGKCIGSSPCKKDGPSDPIMTNKRKAWQQWTLSETDDGSITLKSNSHNLYIGIDKSSKVTLSETAGPSEMWSVEESPHGGIFLISDEHRVCLSCNESGVLKAVSGKDGVEETWTLVPSMPSSLSGPVIGTIVGLGLATAAFACAAPFMVTGAVAALGFGEAGIVGGSTAAAMMSAEAMAASTGGVAAGGLVATCQSIGAAGLGFVGTSTAIAGGGVVGGTLSAATVAGISNVSKKKTDQTADENNRKEGVDCLAPSTNRPFCAWRTW